MSLRCSRAARQRRSRSRAVALAALLAAAAVGCASAERSQSYERVAKEWSKAIRASQVIPIYPLSEDIQPGDMFIVDVPIETEQELWDEKGYLKLGYHVGRLPIDAAAYNEFYGNGYGNGGVVAPPLLYQATPVDAPSAAGSLAASSSSTTAAATTAPATPGTPERGGIRRSLQNWGRAPEVAFPTYSVDVSRAGGFNVGLPVQGVPLALGFLGSSRATASISLGEAYTYGLDAERIFDHLRAAYVNPAGTTEASPLRRRLTQFAPRWDRHSDGQELHYRFLRVVTRVYLVGSVDVSLTDHSDWAGDLGFGSPGLQNNLQVVAQLGENAAAYQKLLDALNKGLIGSSGEATTKPSADAGKGTNPATPATEGSATTVPAAPKPPATQPSTGDTARSPLDDVGARIKVLSVSDKSIGLREQFEKPLVIGYVAFDLPIAADGKLGGRRIDTFERVQRGERPSLGDQAKQIEHWLMYDPDAAGLLEEWGGANAAWLLSSGFTEFATPGQRSYDPPSYTKNSLRRYFANGDLPRIWHFFETWGPFGRLQRHWRALYARVSQEMAMAPDGVFRPIPVEDASRPIPSRVDPTAAGELIRQFALPTQ